MRTDPEAILARGVRHRRNRRRHAARPGVLTRDGRRDGAPRSRRRRASGTTTHAGLAFRRLAIIDLDERSNQPLHLGPWHLVFNGEIYNYRELREELRELGHTFVTEGDGEVLLHAWDEWGERALDRVNGMFAFAIWHDERRDAARSAADPFGEKPALLGRDGERLVVRVRHPRACRPARHGAPRDGGARPVPGARADAADRRVASSPACAGCRPRTVLRFADGRVDRRAATGRRARSTCRRPTTTRSRALRELLVDSIRLRLRSDVPVGTSLSGGVDSSAVVALAGAARRATTRHAFTARFPGYERDEWDVRAQVAQRRRASSSTTRRRRRRPSCSTTSTRSCATRRSRSAA